MGNDTMTHNQLGVSLTLIILINYTRETST